MLEPTYAVASERYVDLTRFYDVDAAKARRAEIIALSDEYRAHYRSAYRILRAMGEVESERRTAMHAQMDFLKLRRRTNGILARELRGEGTGSGRVDRAFLGGVTHRGEICRFDTVEALCPRIYAIIDSAGLGNEMLETVVQAAQAKHFDIIACPNPDRPRELHHVLIPEKGLAFITTNARNPYDGKPYRRLRLDAMAEEKLTRAQKAKLRFTRRVEASLLDEAVGALSDAKKAHDALETLCLDRDTQHYKQQVALKFADLVYNGQWFTPLREALSAFVDKTSETVTGDVKLKLYKGNIIPAGTTSPYSLYSENLVTFGESDYDQNQAAGFINLWGLPTKVQALREQGKL